MFIHPPLLFIGNGRKELPYSRVDWGIQIFCWVANCPDKNGQNGRMGIEKQLTIAATMIDFCSLLPNLWKYKILAFY